MELDQIDLKTLRLFIRVAEELNMARAAETEHLEPPAVSKRMTKLETSLGTRLFQRVRHGLRLTDAGLSFLENARAIEFSMRRAQQNLAHLSKGSAGRVTLFASSAAIAQFMLDDIAGFMSDARYSQIRVDIEQRGTAQLRSELMQNSGAVGICWNTIDTSGLETLAYRRDQLCIAVPTAHPLAIHQSIAFHDTLEFEHVGLPPTAALHGVLNRASAGKQLRYRLIVSNLDTALRVVANGFGISVIPRDVGQGSAKALGVKLIPLTDEWANCQFIICYKTRQALAPAALNMLDYLAHCASKV